MASAPPSIANLEGDTNTQTEDQAYLGLIDTDSDAVITDVDSTDFGGGSLTVTIADYNGTDTLGIVQDDDVAVDFGTGEVSVNNTVIGTVTGGATEFPYTGTMAITFNQDATPALVETLLHHIFAADQHVEPVGGTRNLTVTLDDGAGGSNTYHTSFTVVAINDEPGGADKTITMNEDGAYALQTSDFGFTDNAAGPFSEGQNLLAVKITTLPTAGTLYLDPDGAGTGSLGTAVVAGDFVSAADIAAGKLVFVPDADANGTAYASFTFQVQDDGGTANPGDVDTDTTPNTITFDVTAVNDAAAITGTTTGSVTEASGVANATPGTAQATGDLNDTDVDNTADSWTAASGTRTYGSYALNADGTWIYTLDDSNASVQALNTGGTLTDTFTAATVDGTTQVVTITIHGANDAAVITGNVGDLAGDVTEASGVANGTPGTAQATGDLNDTDVDNAPDSWTAASGARTYGSYALNADGTWTYTLDDSNASVQALNTGGTLTDTFTAATVDGTTQVVTITIHGANDAAVITGTTTGSVTEASGVANGTPGTAQATGDLNDTDVDNAADSWTAASGARTYGSYALNADGTWTYTLDDSNASVQALNTGGTLTDTFTAATVDGTTQVVTITIHGANDAAVITGNVGDLAGDVTEASGVANGTPGTAQATGDLNDTDVDNAPDSWTAASGARTYGSYALNADGTWTYTLDDSNASVQALNTGGTLTDTFTAATVDGTTQVVTITIHGANDAAVITGTTTGSVTEASGVANGTPGTAQATGDLNDTDVDNTADSWTAASGTRTYGSYALNADGTWTYTLDDNNASVQALNTGGTLTDTFTAATVDGTTQVVTITIHGANDAAVITGNVGDLAGDVTEASGVANGTPGTAQATGDLNDTDVDNTPDSWTAASGARTYGSYALNADGTWTYTLDDNNASVQALNTGGTLTDTFTAATVDGTTQVVTITIHGANDAAVITGNISGDVTEASGVGNATPGTAQATGDLNDTDVDNAPDSWTAASGARTYGSYALNADGTWTYTLDDSNASVQALNTGGTLTDTFTAATVDGTTQVVTITIHGANDAAVITGTTTGSVTEASGVANGTPGTAQATGDLNDTDVDNTADSWTAASGTRTYGSYALNADGTWTYTLDDSNASVQALNTGGTLTDTFTAATVDGTTQVVTITIHGANDAAVITGTTTGSVTEASGVANGTPGTAQATGDLNDTDVDNTADSWTAASGTRTYGSYALNADGTWTYTLDDSNASVQALNTGGTLTDTFTAATVDGTTQVVTITIHGANDAAVITGTTTGSVTEASGVANGTPGTAQATGDLNDTDVDNTADSWTAASGTRTYGSYALNADGTWTYTLDDDNASVQALNTGGTLTDTFTAATVDGTTQVVTITIHGANDAAVITGDISGSVTEASGVANATPGTAQATGDLNDTDVDNAPDSWTAASGARTYGSYALNADGTWTYTLDDSNASVQALNTGGTLTDTFTAATVDGTTQVVTITIHGANDAAVITGTTTGSADETNAPVTIAGDLNATDVDSDPAFDVQSDVPGTYGSFSIDGTGAWSYVANSAFDELAFGESHAETFTVSTSDGTTEVVTVTINGTNDAPLFSGTGAISVFTENGSAVRVAGTGTVQGPVTVSASDIDSSNYAGGTLGASITTGFHAGDMLSLALSGTPNSGVEVSGTDVKFDGTIVGTLSGSGTSSLSILLNASADDNVVQALTKAIQISSSSNDPTSDTRTVTLTLVDGGGTDHGGQDTASYTRNVTFIAVNDAPSGVDHTITVQENAPKSLFATDFSFTDLENNGFASVTIASLPTHGTLFYDADGPGGNPPVAIIAGTTFTAADLVGGKLTFVPVSNEAGTNYASFTYIVRDNGGTDHGGQDTDPTANTITLNVFGPNTPPHATGLDSGPPNNFIDSVTFVEDTAAGVVFIDDGRDAVITDGDSANFAGGILQIHIVANNVPAEDEIDLITGTNGITMTSTAVTVDVVTFGEDPDTHDPTETHTPTPGHTNEVFVDGVSIGTYTYVDSAVPKDILINLNSGATADSITRLIHNVSYFNSNTIEPDTHQRLVEIRLSDGDGGTMSNFTTINVVSVDDPAVAHADAVTTDEATPVSGSVFSNNGSGADNDIDGPALSVSAVNGSGANVGTQITLASGALLTLNADGTFAYDPNHAFDATPDGGSGASNTPAQDSFTYTLAGGDTATVTVTIDGLDSNDLLIGTGGDDQMDGGSGNDILLGAAGVDILFGGSGADLLEGGAGADQLHGGTGNDTYFVDQAGDVLFEATGEGLDVVYASASYELTAGAEIEILSTNQLSATVAINLVGNELDNTLYGNAGANLLAGGGGSDILIGLGDNDTYLVDDARVRVIESAGGGTDVIYTSVSYTLEAGSDVEILSTNSQVGTSAINLIGNELDNTLYGNDGANLFAGGGGNDILIGLGGNDTYLIDDARARVIESAGGGTDVIYTSISYTLEAGSDVEILSTTSQVGTSAINLTGNELDNTLYGNDGLNVMSGGGGNDILIGFGGNDVYYVDDAHARVIESGGGGTDVVYTSISYTLEAGSAVEILSTTSQVGTNAINLTGNELDNIIYGNAGLNVLSGGTGNDILIGFGGNDVYYVDDAHARVIESAGGGTDVVYTSVSYTLEAGSAVEILSTTSQVGTGAINLAGNEFDNIIYGNAGANLLDGKGGNDVLLGFGGADSFAFTTALGAGNVDLIGDFQSGTDKIVLDHAIFDGLGIGTLGPGVFGIGPAATNEDQRIVYDQTTGNLYYDADGDGAGVAVLFANLQGAPALTASDFHVI